MAIAFIQDDGLLYRSYTSLQLLGVYKPRVFNQDELWSLRCSRTPAVKEGSTNISAYTAEDNEKSKFIVKLIAVAFLGTQDRIMHPFSLK